MEITNERQRELLTSLRNHLLKVLGKMNIWGNQAIEISDEEDLTLKVGGVWVNVVSGRQRRRHFLLKVKSWTGNLLNLI